MDELTGLMIGIAPVLTALAWCNLRDRRIDLANKVRAHMSATVNSVLGGESLVAVRVEPSLGRRLGRVHLSAPRAYESPRAGLGRGAAGHARPLRAGRARGPGPGRPIVGVAMAKRILLVVREGAHAARQSAALAAGRLARESGGAVRIMYVSPLRRRGWIGTIGWWRTSIRR